MENLIIFLGLVMAGLLLEIVVSKTIFVKSKKHFKKHHFFFSRFIFLAIAPLMAVFFISTKTTMPLIQIFIVFSIFGTFLEWFIGFSFDRIMGSKLWTYHFMPIGIRSKYTSFLSIPIWGAAGVLFWLLVKAF